MPSNEPRPLHLQTNLSQSCGRQPVSLFPCLSHRVQSNKLSPHSILSDYAALRGKELTIDWEYAQ